MTMRTASALAVLLLLAALLSCATTEKSPADVTSGDPVRWAIAIHGGAGVIPKTIAAEQRDAYLEALEAALSLGRDRLADGGRALDVVEAVIRQLEDDPKFNAGKGAVFTAEARHELDASIMDGRTLACGAITGVRTVRHPISLARAVMERSRHVFFSGDGAEVFADSLDLERVPNEWFDTEKRRRQLSDRQAGEKIDKKGTVGCVVLDVHGDLAAATSTGGMTNKKFGRIGDSPIIGAGTYANNASCAVSCTGSGEEFIRHTVARDIAARLEYRNISLDAAAREVVFGKLAPGDGGIIAVSHTGEIAMVFNCPGMFRAAANAAGRFDISIWK